MRVFKEKVFARFARRNKISDESLCEAVDRANRGLADADLGFGVIKQRIARPNQGKSGGFRTIIFFRKGELAIFVFGFSKSDLDNIDEGDVKILRRTAQETLALTEEEIQKLVVVGSLIEVTCDEHQEGR